MQAEPGLSCSSTMEESALFITCDNFVVGDEPCTFMAVCDTLRDSNSSMALWSKLDEVSKALEYSNDRWMITSTSLTIRTTSHYSVLHEILETWRGRKSYAAKLHTLISVLENRGLQNCADALRLKFCVCGKALTEEEKRPFELAEISDPDIGSTISMLATNADGESEHNSTSYKIYIAVFIFLILLVITGSLVWLLVFKLATNLEPADVQVQITVKSYLEYDSKMKEIPSYYRVSLFINVTDPMDWEGTFSLKNVDKVTGISMEGMVPLKAIFQILEQSAQHLTSLTIADYQVLKGSLTLNICNYTNMEETSIDSSKSIAFPMLQDLRFEGPSCVNIFKLFKSNINLPSVANFIFSMGNLDLNEYSEGFIEQVAQSSTNSLKLVCIYMITKGPGFWTFGSEKLPVLPNVSTLTLESSYKTYSNFNVTDYNIHHLLNDVFPNVKKLIMNGFILPQSFFVSTLSFMRNLIELHIGVAVEGMEFDLNCIPKQVKSASLYVAFRSCNISGQLPSVISINYSRLHHMEYIRVGGNCEYFMAQQPFILTDKFEN